MGWLVSTDADFVNGSASVSINDGLDVSAAQSGWVALVGGDLYEVQGGSGNTLTLAEAWAGASVTGTTLRIIPTSGGLVQATSRLNTIANLHVDYISKLAAFATQMGTVDFIDILGIAHTVNTIPQTIADFEGGSLPVYADNAAALTGGLVAGQRYRTSSGAIMIVF